MPKAEWWIGAGLLAGLVVAGCGGSNPQTLAQVGGEVITTDDFDMALDNLPDNYKVLAESLKGKRKILGNLVKKDLLILEARRRGYDKEPEVQSRIREMRQQAQERLRRNIAELQKRLKSVDRQAYENVLLNELNRRLKEQGVNGVNVTDADIQAYYEDYARKLKILNPAAKTPPLEDVRAQIHSILNEEALIKQLEKDYSVDVREKVFETLYGDEASSAVIDDRSAR